MPHTSSALCFSRKKFDRLLVLLEEASTQGKSHRRDSCGGHALAEMRLGARFPGSPRILGMNAKRPDRNS
jgi:hypothetical protein